MAVTHETLARRLQWATILWNLMEVGVTVTLGVLAGSLALVAFGLDSLVEVFASLVVLWQLRGPGRRDERALRLVALAFVVLAAYLVVAGTRALVVGAEPERSPLGIAYLAVTAVVMFGLAVWKRRLARSLGSSPFQAEASMTFLDGCLASGILAALAANAVLGWWWADPVAALAVAVAAADAARRNLAPWPLTSRPSSRVSWSRSRPGT